jgi:hypothetical protein
MGQLGRLSTELRGLTGTRSGTQAEIARVLQQQREQAVPAGNAAYQAADRAIWSDELERISSDPDMKAAMNTAMRNWQRTQIANGYGAMNPGLTVERGGMMRLRYSGRVPVFPNLQFWDYTRQALEERLAKAERVAEQTGQTRQFDELRNIYNVLRTQVRQAGGPAYAQLLDMHPGKQAYMQALEHGKQILSGRMDADLFERSFRAMNAAEQQGVREAAISKIIQQFESSTEPLEDLTKNLRSIQMRRKIAALMPDAASRARWTQFLDREILAHARRSEILKYAPKARKLAEAQFREKFGEELLEDLGMHAVGALGTVGLKASVARMVMAWLRKSRAANEREIASLMQDPALARRMPQILGAPPAPRFQRTEDILRVTVRPAAQLGRQTRQPYQGPME